MPKNKAHKTKKKDDGFSMALSPRTESIIVLGKNVSSLLPFDFRWLQVLRFLLKILDDSSSTSIKTFGLSRTSVRLTPVVRFVNGYTTV